MVKISRLLLLLGFCGVAVSVDAGERIVSLKPNITDILLRLGVREELVGVTTYCTLPPELGQLPRVADYVKPNLERIVALRPTLIIGAKENSQQKEIERLRTLGLRVELASFQSLEEIYESIRQIARWTTRAPQGAWVEQALGRGLALLRGRVEARDEPVRLLMVVGQSPLVAVGGASVFQSFLDSVGIHNVLADNRMAYPTLAYEHVLALDPDWIVDVSSATPTPQLRSFYERTLSAANAVRRGRLILLGAALFLPGPSTVEGLEQLLAQIEDK